MNFWDYYFNHLFLGHPFIKNTTEPLSTQTSFKAAKDKYELEVQLAGCRKEDVEILVGTNIVVKAKNHSDAKFRIYEDMMLFFATASMENGLLKISIPRNLQVRQGKILIA